MTSQQIEKSFSEYQEELTESVKQQESPAGSRVPNLKDQVLVDFGDMFSQS